MLETLCRNLKMVRLSAFAALAALSLGACVGDVPGTSTGGDDDTTTTDPKEIAANTWANEAYPLFKASCASCHADPNSTSQPAFLVGTDAAAMRATLLNFNPQVIDVRAGSSSRVYVKGQHLGPAWKTDKGTDGKSESDHILSWINAEVAAAASDTTTTTTVIETDMIMPTMCTVAVGGDVASCAKTTVDLTKVGLAGATITFVAQPLSANQGLYLDFLQVTGSTAGAYLEHPLFVSYPTAAGAMPVPDDIDRFYDLKVDVMPSATMNMGPGEAAFLTFAPTDPIKISFRVVTPYVPPTTVVTAGGCKDVATFIAKAQPELNTRCASCHTGTGNPNAKSSMDLTGIATPTNATAIATACAQALSHANTVQQASSAILVEPDPAQAAGHPYKITNAGQLTTYQTNIKAWITAEQGAAP